MTVITLKLIIALCITLLYFQTRLGLLVSSHIALLCDYLVTVLTGRHLLLHYHVLSRIFDLGYDFPISERDLRFWFIFWDLGLVWYLTRVMKNLSEEFASFSVAHKNCVQRKSRIPRTSKSYRISRCTEFLEFPDLEFRTTENTHKNMITTDSVDMAQ